MQAVIFGSNDHDVIGAVTPGKGNIASSVLSTRRFLDAPLVQCSRGKRETRSDRRYKEDSPIVPECKRYDRYAQLEDHDEHAGDDSQVRGLLLICPAIYYHGQS